MTEAGIIEEKQAAVKVYSSRMRKEEIAIRYVYRPYHPWRHGYRREKWRRRMFLVVRILLVLECLWFSYGYIKKHTTEKTMVWEENCSRETDDEVFGFGFGSKDGTLFWFHSYFEGLE